MGQSDAPYRGVMERRAKVAGVRYLEIKNLPGYSTSEFMEILERVQQEANII